MPVHRREYPARDPLRVADAREEDRTVEPSVQKWEYCAVSGFQIRGSVGLSGYYPAVVYFKEDEPTAVPVKGGDPEEDGRLVAQEIARLGELGWEMVGCTNYHVQFGMFVTVFFKRPKRRHSPGRPSSEAV